MILNYLTKSKQGRKSLPPSIFARLPDLQGEEITARMLCEWLHVDRRVFDRVMKAIITPYRYENIEGKIHAVYDCEELRRLGRYFNDGCRWRKKKNEQ